MRSSSILAGLARIVSRELKTEVGMAVTQAGAVVAVSSWLAKAAGLALAWE